MLAEIAYLDNMRSSLLSMNDPSRSCVYRWNEDGLGGICDKEQRLCFSLALWNGRDPILKERAFGLTGNEGNHGEDVKEAYFYLDATRLLTATCITVTSIPKVHSPTSNSCRTALVSMLLLRNEHKKPE